MNNSDFSVKSNLNWELPFEQKDKKIKSNLKSNRSVDNKINIAKHEGLESLEIKPNPTYNYNLTTRQLEDLEFIQKELSQLKESMSFYKEGIENTLKKLKSKMNEHNSQNNINYKKALHDLTRIINGSSLTVKNTFALLGEANATFELSDAFQDLHPNDFNDFHKLIYNKLALHLSLFEDIFHNENGVKEFIEEIKNTISSKATAKMQKIVKTEDSKRSNPSKISNVKNVHFNKKVETQYRDQGPSINQEIRIINYENK